MTEDSIQGDFSVIGRVLEQLVHAGAELAIDDFGTGYSSLSRLKSLPFSRIKIDGEGRVLGGGVEAERVLLAGLLGLEEARVVLLRQ